ncbi:MAG TPA: hypothetical protein VEU51_06030 [Candidatus Acidoferrales bacterium]|nr:hypothetical protein [Candidatus Acidoferrales bacterium]
MKLGATDRFAGIATRRATLVALAALLFLASARLAPADDSLNFPPTNFTIVDPASSTPLGTSRYSIESHGDRAVLRGENRYYSGLTDVETANLELNPGADLPRLVEFDHTFYNADGSIQERAHVDLKSGHGICIDNQGPQKSEQAAELSIPADTWAGASVVIPIQRYLRAGEKGVLQLHAFNCAPSPKIYAISVESDPGEAVWAQYRELALRVEVRPDFGWFNLIVAAFVPRLHVWFDPRDGWNFVGDEAARYYKGPPIMLVKARASAPVASARTKK